MLGCSSGDGGETHLVAAVGDSITAGNPGFDPNPAVRRALHLGDDPRSQWEYWARREHPDLVFRNCGVRGEPTGQIFRRLQDCMNGAQAVVIQGGVNDLVRGFPPETAALNLRRMVEAAKSANVPVALADVLPVNTTHPQADALIDELNRRIDAIGASEHVTVLPFHDTLEDPDRPGTMKPKWTADGIHPSVAGYRRLGELAFTPPGD